MLLIIIFRGSRYSDPDQDPTKDPDQVFRWTQLNNYSDPEDVSDAGCFHNADPDPDP